ncbi:glycosyltransferase family 2 protein [Salimicrobium halophilum]|uniref:Glycosyltransferase involved in cell wall bisynthesis n=1 Tax=Salimicrobium halophilum TaxID=86666 RepID=A0A1G8UHY7_9BACI|nr:glycosyltransferase [Salimicrobium halophilum]SDJ53349.1 Glycosyltransferase involved in cell wall bisynthesis [Salimicrobium halophilum]
MSRLSVILPIRNEEETLAYVLQEVLKLNPFEIITVINGSTDTSRDIAERHHCVVYEYTEPLGHDTGRAIGAHFSEGDILLFLDGDMVIPYQELLPFIQVIEQGADIALNDLKSLLDQPHRPHSVSILKKSLNDIFRYGGLSINSMVAIPHAISRKALEEIGWFNLSIPPLAQGIAMKKQLEIVSPAFVDVVTLNKIRPELHLDIDAESTYVLLENIIIGDHLNAIHHLIQEEGSRGGFPDSRHRAFLHHLKKRSKAPPVDKSAIICDEGKSPLPQVLKQTQNLQQAGVEEVIVVTYDQDEEKITILSDEGIPVIPLHDNLGSCITRAVGAFYSRGDKVLLTTADQPLSPDEYQVFFNQLEEDTDIVLPDQSSLLDDVHPIDEQQTLRYLLNLLLRIPHQWNNSLYAFPHAMKRGVIDDIGYSSLLTPPLAQVKALMNNYRILSVPSPVFFQKEEAEVFIGDHLEAIHWFLQMTDARGTFSSGDKDYKAFQHLVNTSSLPPSVMSDIRTYFDFHE